MLEKSERGAGLVGYKQYKDQAEHLSSLIISDSNVLGLCNITQLVFDPLGNICRYYIEIERLRVCL